LQECISELEDKRFFAKITIDENFT